MKKKWIINSLLDLDAYKLFMLLFAFRYYPDVPVRYAFKNRTKSLPLLEYIDPDQLAEELHHVSTLRIDKADLTKLAQINIKGVNIFGRFPDFMEFLGDLKLDFGQLAISADGDNPKIEAQGKWTEVELWETLKLSIVSSLFGRGYMAKYKLDVADVAFEGLDNLDAKIVFLKKHPEIKNIVEFGTRRRFHGLWWQREVYYRLRRILPDQVIGTSNVALAMERGEVPQGTMAHSLFQVLFGVYHDRDNRVAFSQNKVYEQWHELFAPALMTALTDTYSTDFAFQNMNAEMFAWWNFFRHDSGPADEYVWKVLRKCRETGLDPMKTGVIFSDGLTVEAMAEYAQYVTSLMNYGYGWGTDLTNDVGIPTPSIVSKAVWSNGRGTVKTSDNIAKAIGAPADIEEVKAEIGYNVTFKEDCKY